MTPKPARTLVAVLLLGTTHLAVAEPGASAALTASAEATNTNGLALPLPGKSVLPRREDAAVLAVEASGLGGNGIGAEAVAELRLVESFGIGLGGRVTDRGASPILRFTPAGFAVNHWSWIAFIDVAMIDGSATFGGAMMVPVRKDKYLRFSIQADEHAALGGLGLEVDVW